MLEEEFFKYNKGDHTWSTYCKKFSEWSYEKKSMYMSYIIVYNVYTVYDTMYISYILLTLLNILHLQVQTGY